MNRIREPRWDAPLITSFFCQRQISYLRVNDMPVFVLLIKVRGLEWPRRRVNGTPYLPIIRKLTLIHRCNYRERYFSMIRGTYERHWRSTKHLHWITEIKIIAPIYRETTSNYPSRNLKPNINLANAYLNDNVPWPCCPLLNLQILSYHFCLAFLFYWI